MIAGSPSLCVVLMEPNTSGHGVGNHEYNFFEHTDLLQGPSG